MNARRLRITGLVQGVGFRPFVARQAAARELGGWVSNDEHGVEIHVEGSCTAIAAFEAALRVEAPAVARIDDIQSAEIRPQGFAGFRIRASERRTRPTAPISPDLAVCGDCLRELFDRDDRRFAYPYINCTACGPRYSVVRALPYDRERTTMTAWPLCRACAAEYENPRDRRFHAQPVACPSCGPQYTLVEAGPGVPVGDAFERAARLLREGAIVAIKGVGGYHLSCDARNAAAVRELRSRKYRKSRPFALMAGDLEAARALVQLPEGAEALLTAAARPIVLLPARAALPGVAPGHPELGVMLPYAPLHHLLFAAGAPEALVMTSGNRSSEPVAYEDADALERLAGIADAFLIGERPIARRVDDSILRLRPSGAVMLRRGRGYAPAIVADLPGPGAILAVGADLKNTVTLVIGGRALLSEHIGDLEYASVREAFRRTIADLTALYEVNGDELRVAHDLHPHYASTAEALGMPAAARIPVQHHRAHVASVLAEHGALERTVIGVAFDGTGHGDDGTVWGGEFFAGSLRGGLRRVASLLPFALPGGDAAARHPTQAAAGILADIDGLPDLTAPPFLFGPTYGQARKLARSGFRTFRCTSAGRAFDAAAALLGFTGTIEYEGQAAVWLENLAWRAAESEPLPFVVSREHLDLRPALGALIEGRLNGQPLPALARGFHEAVAAGICRLALQLCETHGAGTVALSGGTFQNALLMDRLECELSGPVQLLTNRLVPPNDGGISLGQAAIAAMAVGG